MCRVWRKWIDCVPFLNPTSFLLLVNFVERIWVSLLPSCCSNPWRIYGSHLFSLTSWLCREYPWLLSLLDFVDNFLGPLYDSVNPSFWSNLSPSERLFFLSFSSIPSPILGIHLFQFSFSSILFGPPPRFPFISSWFCLQLFYCFLFLSHWFASSLYLIPPRPQTPLSKLEKFLNLQSPFLTWKVP